MHRGKACKDKERRWSSASLEERAHQKPTLLIPWSWISSLQNCEKINFCCLVEDYRTECQYYDIVWVCFMFSNCNHCCFCCGHPCTMLGISLFISCKNKIQCVCVKKKNFCCLSHLLHGILLWQPEQTNTIWKQKNLVCDCYCDIFIPRYERL